LAFGGLNYLAVVVAAAVGFAFGAIYYMTLGKSWMAALGKTEDGLKGGARAAPFVVAIVAQLVMAFVLAGTIGHLGPGQVTPLNGVISGAFAWAGFVATSMSVNYAFQKAKPSLTFIDGGHWLGVLLIQGLVIGLMGVRPRLCRRTSFHPLPNPPPQGGGDTMTEKCIT
jgi:hypothetical protein